MRKRSRSGRRGRGLLPGGPSAARMLGGPSAARVLVVLVAIVAMGCTTMSREDKAKVERRAQAHYDLGVDHLANGRNELALRELLAAEELRPEDPWTHLWMAEAFRRKLRTEAAEEHLLRALRLDPGFQEARLNLSALYIQLERYEDAVEQSELLWDDPTFPGPWRALTNLGWSQMKLGRTAEARKNLERAVDMEERYWPAILDLAILEAEEGHRLEALRRFQQVLAVEPPQTVRDEVHFRMAEVYVSLGRRGRALAHFRAAAAGNEKARWAQESQRYLKLLR